VRDTAGLPSSVHDTEALLFFTLLQLTAIVLAARLCGNLSVRWGNSRAVGEIAAGILLGPSLFGLLWPAGFQFVFRSAPPEPLAILSQVGLILLLFQIGLEFDFSHLREARNRHAVLRIALLGEVLPFALGFAFGQLSASAIFPQGSALGYSLFCATAFSITALPVLGRIMLELDLQRTEIGAVAISASAINDVLGWLLLAVVSALAMAHFSAGAFAFKVALFAVFVGASWWIVRPLLVKLVHHPIARACDRLAVLHHGRLRALAPPAEALTPAILAKVFGLEGGLVESPAGPVLAARRSGAP